MTRPRRRPAPARVKRDQLSPRHRYTIDASVFVNAFNPHEDGHAESLRFVTLVKERGDPIVVPTLLVPEVASAIARATDDSAGALQYAMATAGLPHVTLIALMPTIARQAAELAATHRLRGADAVYLAVARRFATILVSRDEEQRTRGAAVAICQTPEEALLRSPTL